jgi:triosephosphate isomerase
MRAQIVAGNWKMNKTFEEGVMLAYELVGNELLDTTATTVIVAPPFIHLGQLAKMFNGTPIKLAGQNCHFKNSGAYTGEVSPAMLKSVGAEYVILGHSERREYFAETNEIVLQKTKVAIEAGLKVIFCCGEPLKERENGDHKKYVERQLEDSILKLSDAELVSVVIAYEPIWAIGTGLTASAEQAQEMHRFIREKVSEQFSEATGSGISILYGGSVKADNAKAIFAQPDVDGGLIGGASLVADDFLKIVDSF